MEITPSTIYWITRADKIQALIVVMAMISFAASVVFLARLFVEWNDHDQYPRRVANAAYAGVAAFLLSCVALAFVPTTKELAAIYVIPRIANSQTVRELGAHTVEAAKRWLDGMVDGREGAGK